MTGRSSTSPSDQIGFIEAALMDEEDLPRHLYEMIESRANDPGFDFQDPMPMGFISSKWLRAQYDRFLSETQNLAHLHSDIECERIARRKLVQWVLNAFFPPKKVGKRSHEQDWGQAYEFLRSLQLDEWRLQPVYGGKLRKVRPYLDNRRGVKAKAPDTIQVDAALHEMSLANAGDYSILVQLHPGKSPKAKSVTSVQTLFADLDQVDPKKLELKPTWLVRSSKGRHHAYYRLTKTVEPALGLQLNRALCRLIGADEKSLDIAGRALKVPLPGIPRTRRGKTISTPTVIQRGGPIYDPDVLMSTLGVDNNSSSGPIHEELLARGEILPAHYRMTLMMTATRLVETATNGERLARLREAAYLLSPYQSHGLHPATKARLINLAVGKWPECESTIRETVNSIFRLRLKARAPAEYAKRRGLDNWAMEILKTRSKLYFGEVEEARPPMTSVHEARLALSRAAKLLEWTMSRQRFKGRKSILAEAPEN